MKSKIILGIIIVSFMCLLVSCKLPGSTKTTVDSITIDTSETKEESLYNKYREAYKARLRLAAMSDGTLSNFEIADESVTKNADGTCTVEAKGNYEIKDSYGDYAGRKTFSAKVTITHSGQAILNEWNSY